MCGDGWEDEGFQYLDGWTKERDRSVGGGLDRVFPRFGEWNDDG